MSEGTKKDFIDFIQIYNKKIGEIYGLNCNMEMLTDISESSLLNEKEKRIIIENDKIINESFKNIYKKEFIICKTLKNESLVSLISYYNKNDKNMYINVDLFLSPNSEVIKRNIITGLEEYNEKSSANNELFDCLQLTFMGENRIARKVVVKNYIFLTMNKLIKKESLCNATCVEITRNEKMQKLKNLLSNEEVSFEISDVIKFNELFKDSDFQVALLNDIIEANANERQKREAKEIFDTIENAEFNDFDADDKKNLN